MNHHDATENETDEANSLRADPKRIQQCPLPAISAAIAAVDSTHYQELIEAGCPLAMDMRKRLSFEALLSELSAKFVNVPANQVDSQIDWGLQRIVELLEIDRCGLGQVSTDRKQLVVTHSYQLPGVPPSAKLMLDSDYPVYAKMIHQGMVVRLPDDMPPDETRVREYCRQTGLQSNLTIPLVVRGTVVGGIGFSSFRSRRILPDELIPRLRLVGDIFTNALARKRADEALGAKEQLLRQAKEGLQQLSTKLLLSQEEERSRIAREMHDDWTQRLALLGIDAANLENQLGSQDTALPLVHAIRERLVSLADDVHALSRQLHPSIIDDLGLTEALRSECASFSRREGIHVGFVADNVPTNLPKEIALCFYRVAQESLRNIAKHAAVREATIKLVSTGTGLTLTVTDQGIGFSAGNGRTQLGIGLASMEERVHLIGGKLTINSAPDQGTTVVVQVPLKAGLHE